MSATPDGESARLLADGARAIREGRAGDAIAAFAGVTARQPALADAWFNKAWAERADRRFADALESYAQALAHGVAGPEEVHLNRAAILSDQLFRPDEAEAELRAALAANPRFLLAWLNLGTLYEDLGRPNDARAAYGQALTLDPGNGRAHARLATIEQHIGDPSRAAAALKAALPGARGDEDRADMLFALGGALDAQGAYDDAFQAYEAANWLARSLAPVRYDAAAQERLVTELIGTVSAPLPAAKATPGSRPVFVCGMFRSGSTLAEQLLGRHPAITPAGELELIPALVQREFAPYPDSLRALTSERATTLRRTYLDAVAATHPGAAIVTDKRCDNVLYIGLIKALFPEALIVHTTRTPLDNLLSIWFLHFGEAVRYGNDLREAAHYYVQYRRLMTHWRALYGNAIVDVAYETLVTDPRAALTPVLDALGLGWNDALLTPPADSAVRTASVWQVRQPLHTRSSGRWRRYARQVEPVRALLAAAGLPTEP